MIIFFVRICALTISITILLCLNGCMFTYSLNEKTKEMSNAKHEISTSPTKLQKYTSAILIDNKLHDVYYGNILIGKNRTGYLIFRLKDGTGEMDGKYIITDDILKYRQVQVSAINYDVATDAYMVYINDRMYNRYYGIEDLNWAERSYTKYIFLNALYIISVPLDIITFPLQWVYLSYNPM